ncbi:MAG: STM4014 family protein [Myxococcota bacterium]|nr:STM4014 family protein [Myxococcota bacterium]
MSERDRDSARGAPPFVLIGNPVNRRVTLFQDALAAQGMPAAHVIPWLTLLEPGAPAALLDALPSAPAIVRIDSAGEDDEVEHALLRRGEAPARAEGYAAISAAELARTPREVGRIVHPRQHHLGFVAVLDELAAVFATRPAWRIVQPPAAIARLFDKRVTSARWGALGIPVPEPLPGGPVLAVDDLRARMRTAGWPQVFVKVASASSASCLAIFTHDATGEHALTTVEDTGRARYNTRKLQHLTARRGLDRLLGFLLAEGAQVERAIPKARDGGTGDGDYFDLRVVTIDGVAAFVVMRAAPHPITNLHLGGRRGDVEALRARVPPAAWDAAMASCVHVQQDSGAFHVGVDLMFEPALRAHRILEGNAFGDLLPNLTRDGLDVFGWQIDRLRRAS